MALTEWTSIVLDRNLLLEDKERLLLVFHRDYNHRCHTHLLAHGSLLACAIKRRDTQKILTQGWLALAVVPVHTRIVLFRFIRGVAQNPA